MVSNVSFWVVQGLLAPVRLALATCALLGVVMATLLSLMLSQFLLTPIAPVFAVLIITIMGFAVVSGVAIFVGLVWGIKGLLALRHGDMTRLHTLRRAEFYLAIVLTTGVVWLVLMTGPSIWGLLVGSFAAVQWVAWYLLRIWDRPTEWFPLEMEAEPPQPSSSPWTSSDYDASAPHRPEEGFIAGHRPDRDAPDPSGER